MPISSIVAVSISIADSAPKAPAFDTPLIIAKAPYVGSETYTLDSAGLAQMVTDGFDTFDRAYQLVERMAGQSGGAGSAVVYARTNQQTHVLDLTVDIAKTRVGQVLSFDISYQGETSTIEVTIATNTVNDILDLVEAAIDASAAGLAGIGVAADNATATKLTLTADVAGDLREVFGGLRHRRAIVEAAPDPGVLDVGDEIVEITVGPRCADDGAGDRKRNVLRPEVIAQ